MSFDEIIYRIDKSFPSIEMDDNHKRHEIEGELRLYDLRKISDKCKKDKRVSFPDDDNIVSDFFEQEQYWCTRKFLPIEEIMNLYKKSCQLHNIKPSLKIIEQVKDLKVGPDNQRCDIFEICNEKLSLKQVESLEEIFKHVQFKCLDFENSLLDDDAATSFFEIIEYYQSCLDLNLSYNGKISYLGFNALSKMLKKSPWLEVLGLRGIPFTEMMMHPLNRALRFGSQLKILHLENSGIFSTKLQILTAALKLNVHLLELYLSGNKMSPADGILLGSLLKVNKVLKTLDVRNNFLGDAGLDHICAGLFYQCATENTDCDDSKSDKGLERLIICNNSITHMGMPPLAAGLKVTKSLKTLHLGNNPISNEGVQMLRMGLLTNASLFRLSLPNCKITCEGAVAIAEYLADTNQLMRLDIRNNEIRTAGLIALSVSMKVNKSIMRIDIDRNPKRDAMIKSFHATQSDALKAIHQRVEENKAASVKEHEFELSQNFASDFNGHSEGHVVNQSSDSDFTASDDLSSSYQLSSPATDDTSDTQSHNDSHIDPIDIAPPPSSDASPETPPDFFGNKFSNVLSPTDKMLVMKNGTDEDDMMPNWNGDGEIEHFFGNFETIIDESMEVCQ